MIQVFAYKVSEAVCPPDDTLSEHKEKIAGCSGQASIHGKLAPAQ
jgi:hypothetical protein